jgi:hypothetical protein
VPSGRQPGYGADVSAIHGKSDLFGEWFQPGRLSPGAKRTAAAEGVYPGERGDRCEAFPLGITKGGRQLFVRDIPMLVKRGWSKRRTRLTAINNAHASLSLFRTGKRGGEHRNREDETARSGEVIP